MKDRIYQNFLLILMYCSITLVGFSCDQKFYVESTDDGVLVKEGEKNVLFYQQTVKSIEGKYPRANYIHPLYGINGEILTEDFPEDHLHHRGIFWTWHQVYVNDQRIGDGWTCENFKWDIKEVSTEKHSDDVLLKIKTHWKSPLLISSEKEMIPFVSELTSIKVLRSKDHYRLIDFKIALTALVENVKIGGSNDEKGYGGFSVRSFLPEDIVFTSNGQQVVPENTSIEAGPWMDFSGTIENMTNKKWGITIYCHPKNPGFPERWILRKSKSMQNPVYPGRDPVALSLNNSMVIRYRLMIHDGELDYVDMEKIYQEYLNTD